MKTSVNVMSAVLIVGSLMIAPMALASDWAQKVTQDLCEVEGAEELRSKMYEETSDTKEIMELERAACWMIVNKELDRLGKEIIDENGLLFLDGGNILYGRDQQIAMFSEFLNIEGLYFTYEPVEAHVSASRDMAWAFGLYKLQMPGKEMEVGKYTSVWAKNDEGKWLNVSEMRNPFKR